MNILAEQLLSKLNFQYECSQRQPDGKEIYRLGTICIYEVRSYIFNMIEKGISEYISNKIQ